MEIWKTRCGPAFTPKNLATFYPDVAITEPGQEYFQNLAIADFSEIRGHGGCHFG
jgi:hypothetical protein